MNLAAGQQLLQRKLRAAQLRVPRRYTEFCDAIGVKLYPGQRVVAKVAFDGIEPQELKGKERELARKIFGELDEVPELCRAVFVSVCGARSGKSYVFSAIRMVHLALTVNLDMLAPGEVAVGPIVAPDKKLAGQILKYVDGACRKSPLLAALSEPAKGGVVRLNRPDGKTVEIECMAATRGGSAVRGRTFVGGVMDECAFFRDQETGVVNDADVFAAMAPRIVPDGQMLVPSTPWTEAGLLYEFYQRNWCHPVDALVAWAPTLLLRDTDVTRAIVARERARDPENAEREYDAQFMGSSATEFFDSTSIRQATYQGEYAPPAHATAHVGGDFGFDRDSSAQVVSYRDGDLVIAGRIVEQKPMREKPLKPSEVCARVAELCREVGAEYVVADRHYRRAIEEHLNEKGVTLVMGPDGNEGKVESYQLARQLMREGRLRIPQNDRLLRQLREVVARKSTGGTVTIRSPRWKGGGHGDLVSALVESVWDAERSATTVAPIRHDTPTEKQAEEWLEQHRRSESEYERELAEESIWQ